MRKYWRFVTLTALALLQPTATLAREPAVQQATVTAPASAAPQAVPNLAHPAMWKVSDDDTTIYLFGTVHMLPANMQWFDGAIKRAFDESDTLVTEIDKSDAESPDVRNAMIALGRADPQAKPFSQQLSPAQLKRYQAALTSIGLPAFAFEGTKAWVPAIVISMAGVMKSGNYDPAKGADNQLMLEASLSNKTLDHLETPVGQISLFNQLSPADQRQFLMTSIDAMNHNATTFDTMLTAWANGDDERLGSFFNTEFIGSTNLRNLLLVNRNRNWASWIERRMAQPGTVFMAVGAGHLVGQDKVQDFLVGRGMRVHRVTPPTRH